jgi:hypothetical protein
MKPRNVLQGAGRGKGPQRLDITLSYLSFDAVYVSQ